MKIKDKDKDAWEQAGHVLGLCRTKVTELGRLHKIRRKLYKELIECTSIDDLLDKLFGTLLVGGGFDNKKGKIYRISMI